VTLRAANEAGAARDFTLTGELSGEGGFTKTGAGALVLSGVNTFTGDVAVDDGTLFISGSLAAGGTVAVNANGQLAGTGTTAKAITLNNGGTISPGIGGVGTLQGTALVWNGGGRATFDLGASADRLALSGAFTKTGAGSYTFDFVPVTPPAVGDSYTLVTFASTDFAATDFSATGLDSVEGEFTLSGNALTFTITSQGSGSGLALFNDWAAAAGLPAGQNGPSADFDGDGSDNLLEFVLGGDPKVAEVVPVSLVEVTENGMTYPALQYTRRIARGDVQTEVRAAVTLDFINPLGSVEVSATPKNSITETVVVRSAVPIADQPRQFLRLFVTLP
jgi:autotransporter-associated beta strand protein